MKNKLPLDFIIFILLIFVMEYTFTGNLIHEIIGSIFLLGIIIHLFKNKIWIKKSTTNFDKLKGLAKINYLLDTILLIVSIILLITSILISKDLLGFLNIEFNMLYFNIHKISAYIFVIVILIHVILHLNIIFKFLINKLKIEDDTSFKIIFIIILFILSLLSFRHLIKNEVVDENKKEENIPTKNDNNKDNEYIPENNQEDEEEDKETLEEYLSKLRCNGCHRGCLLSSPRCGRGSYYQQEAIKEYNEKYNISMYQENDIIYSSDKKYIMKI